MSEGRNAALQEVIERDKACQDHTTGLIQHGIEFGAEGVGMLAEFVSEGFLHIPSEGQQITLHGVPVVVRRVNVAYEATEDGTPAIYASVKVEPMEGE